MHAASLLLWLAISGGDSNLVLSDTSDQRGEVVFGQQLLSESSPILIPTKSAQGPAESAAADPFLDGQSQVFDPMPGSVIVEPFQPPAPLVLNQQSIDDFIKEMNPLVPTTLRVLEDYYDPYSWQGSFGTNGHQPWRLGWVTYNDITVMPYAPVTSGTTGHMQFTDWNSNVRVSELIAPGLLFNGTGYFNAQWWNGPSGIPLPGQVDQISADLELGLFNGGPWSGQIAFHPQLVYSYPSNITPLAFNFDGRVITTYRASPNWSFVGGIAFWDRVDVLVVPHVGVIWTPDTRWELRLLYPKSRISYYMGRWNTTDFWAYGAFEYTAESWQVGIGNPVQLTDRMQITEDILSLGFRWDSGRYSFFVEGGYVFNREVKFLGPTPDFNLGNIGMIRVGARY